MAKGWIKDERELMQNPAAHTQPLPAYFGLSMMFPHIHPLARAAQNAAGLGSGHLRRMPKL